MCSAEMYPINKEHFRSSGIFVNDDVIGSLNAILMPRSQYNMTFFVDDVYYVTLAVTCIAFQMTKWSIKSGSW